MSANAALLEREIRHQIYLMRRGAGLSNEMLPIITRLIEQVSGRIINTSDQRARQQVMISELRSIMQAAMAELSDGVTQGALDLAEYESQFQTQLLNQVSSASFAAPAIEQIAAVALNDPLDIEPGRQMTVRQALSEFSEKKQRQITQTITDGILQQQTNAEIAKAVQELEPLQRRQADALVRTIASGVSSNSKKAFYNENAEFIKHYRYTATLDSRTRRAHIALDGRTYETIETALIPPQGWNCRCVLVPQVRDDLQLPGFEGDRPAVGADGPGALPARTEYTGFLKRQPVEFQNEVLGEETAKLWRAGRIMLDDLADQFGEPLSLSELKRREGLAL